MIVHETIAGFRAALDSARGAGATVGLVPTMGYLHEGHMSLASRAVAECDVVALTIFVNPIQFAAGEDLDRYPRDLPRDLEMCEAVGVDVVFAPSVEEMYPTSQTPGPERPAGEAGKSGMHRLTNVSVAELGDTMEGATRPGHFDGVSTVVAKLFNIAGPCNAYFGEKDYQQLAIVARMAHDLDFPVEVVGCPIVRELDGLAMSSRNVYLTPAERESAPVLFRALQSGAASILAGEHDPDVVARLMADIIEAEPLAHLDYAEVVDPATMRRPQVIEGEVRLLVAARLGAPRLLDNLGVRAP